MTWWRPGPDWSAKNPSGDLNTHNLYVKMAEFGTSRPLPDRCPCGGEKCRAMARHIRRHEAANQAAAAKARATMPPPPPPDPELNRAAARVLDEVADYSDEVGNHQLARKFRDYAVTLRGKPVDD